MKTLYLLRHAQAAPATPPQMSDFERTLTPQGLHDAETVGKFMQDNGFKPDIVLCSAAKRTTQTAQNILTVLFGKQDGAQLLRELYNAPESELLETVRKADPAHDHLMLVAHNPGVADLAFSLGRIARYEPGTLSIFTAPSWSFFAPGAVKLQKVFAPHN